MLLLQVFVPMELGLNARGIIVLLEGLATYMTEYHRNVSAVQNVVILIEIPAPVCVSIST